MAEDLRNNFKEVTRKISMGFSRDHLIHYRKMKQNERTQRGVTAFMSVLERAKKKE